MSLRPVLVCAAAAVALALTGCSASSDEDAATTAPADKPAAVAAADSGGGVDAAKAEALCAHLKKELPRIKAVGSEVGSMAQLAMSLASFYEDHPKELDGTVLDAQAQQACPQTRTEMLKAAGIKSFADL